MTVHSLLSERAKICPILESAVRSTALPSRALPAALPFCLKSSLRVSMATRLISNACSHNLCGLDLSRVLPLHRTVEHFKKSRRWLRFSCCGKAFPCPICHEASGCPAAIFGIQAHRMICGSCSREQSFSNGLCQFCAFNMVKSSSAKHGWHGGDGTRDRSGTHTRMMNARRPLVTRRSMCLY